MAHNDRKRKSCEYDEICLKKNCENASCELICCGLSHLEPPSQSLK